MFLLLLLLAFVPKASAQSMPMPMPMMMTEPTSAIASPASCHGAMEYWDLYQGMCEPLAMANMPMTMVMLHANAFLTDVATFGPRGERGVSAPDMVMLDVGTTAWGRHYLNVDLMGTAELWTTPVSGYPELLQIGEKNRQGEPFLDAQHPHSSPVMGLTLSDTVTLSGKDHLRVFAAPRGESTDGPVAFMHRATGMMNPDAPLGHHVGQDVGHISSSVIGAGLTLGDTLLETSTFYGREPEPTKVDLPLGRPNSYAARVTQSLTAKLMITASAAFVRQPEAQDDSRAFVTRYSASAYLLAAQVGAWSVYDTFIFGAIHNLDHLGLARSYAEEILLRGDGPNLWGRLEVVQRSGGELAVDDSSTPRWVTAATIGYTHDVLKQRAQVLGLGGSVTRDFLPAEFRPAYGGEPWSAKVFVQVSGMGMWVE